MVGAAAMMVQDFAVTEHGRARINPGTSGERAVGVAGTLELADYTVVIADGSQLAARSSNESGRVVGNPAGNRHSDPTPEGGSGSPGSRAATIISRVPADTGQANRG